MGIFNRISGGAKSKKVHWTIFVILLVGLLAAFLDYPGDLSFLPDFFDRDFKLGLDLQGGTHLVYQADLSNISSENVSESMQGVRDVIERRINLFGVSEPVVQINKAGEDYRLIVELAGIKDVSQAIQMIGQTPALDFRKERNQTQRESMIEEQNRVKDKLVQGLPLDEGEGEILLEDPYFEPTQLTGQYLKGAELQFNQQTFGAQVSLEFDDQGSKIFEDLTRQNIGKRLAIYLDGTAISAPTVQEAITGGKAQITGDFTLDEAKELVRRLNAGALPVPIELINQQTIGASLGKISLDKSLKAGLFGFIAVLLFLIIYYRFPGVLSCLALLIYVVIVLAVFKLIPVTLTLAGIAGFILSIGMAVDANVLIFERLKEELKLGKSLGGSIDEGFARAWPAIRDGNISTIITCLILYIFATGLVKGFALTLGIGVLISMFSAIFVTRSFLRFFTGGRLEKQQKLWR